MVVLLTFALLQGTPKTVHDLPAWKAYAAALRGAQMIEVKWDYAENREPKAQFILRVRDGQKVSLEKVDHWKVVWDGRHGIAIDRLRREYELLKAKPAFDEAAFLEIPGALSGKGNQSSFQVSQSSITAGDRGVSVVKATKHLVDAAAIYTYWFEEENRMKGTMSWLQIEYRGMWEGGEKTVHHSVRAFDLFAMLDSEDFSVKPPHGFVEKKARPDISYASKAWNNRAS
jgi:hypothetical protein